MTDQPQPQTPALAPASASASAASVSASASAQPTLSAATLRHVARLHHAVLLFYAIDAALLTVYGLFGSVSRHLGWVYGGCGIALSVLYIAAFRRGAATAARVDRAALWLALTAAALMLGTTALAPQVGGVMLMSLMAVLAMSTLGISGRQLLLLFVALASGAMAAMTLATHPVQLPTATPAERVVTGIWFAWLLAKCSAQNATGTQLRLLVNQANTKLAQALRDIEQLAATDELTSLPNRRSILSRLQSARLPTAGGNHTTQPVVAVVLFDIDHFKSVNDRHGHHTGDAVLRAFSALLSAGLRPADAVGRYGGEEFLLVMRNVRDAAAARDAAERMRCTIAAHDWSGLADGLRVTASAGVALVGADEDTDAAIRRADAALYAAKGAGRNRVGVG